MKKAIGGYLELDLNDDIIIHKDAVAVNTGRKGLQYILKCNNYKKIYLPFFTCDVVLHTIQDENIAYEFYSIDKNLEPIFDYDIIKDEEVFLYTNYFGLKDSFVLELEKKGIVCIIDNAQAFYATPSKVFASFYSPRKFLGVPDGGYVYCSKSIDILDQDVSYERMIHLLKRVELGAEEGYVNFANNEKTLDGEVLKKMSTLTRKLINSVDHKKVKKKRRDNYQYLYEMFKHINLLDLPLGEESTPLVFPLWIKKNIKQELHSNRCYTATYWPNVLEWTDLDTLESKLSKEVVYLPVDQNTNEEELREIINLRIKQIVKNEH